MTNCCHDVVVMAEGLLTSVKKSYCIDIRVILDANS